MTTPPQPAPYGPIPTDRFEVRSPADLARPSLFLAIATVVVSVVVQVAPHVYVRTSDNFDASAYGALSALGSVLTALVALAALIVGFIALTRGAGNKAAAGAAVGIGGSVVINLLIFVPLSLF